MVDFTGNLAAFTRVAQERLMPKAGVNLVSQSRLTKAAAVLIPIVPHNEGLNVLLTTRSIELPTHAGQIAFPGGKIDANDASPLAAALRETHEETGIEKRFVTPVGYLNSFETGTGFHIVPVVGVLSRGFKVIPEPGEVSDVFEVPLGFLMNPDNHQRKEAMWEGKLRNYHAIPYQDRYIWGATAGMLVDLYSRMSGND